MAVGHDPQRVRWGPTMDVHDDNRPQAEFWGRAGGTWVELRERFDRQAGDHGRAAIDALAPRPGERILDVGCGAGSTTIELAARVGRDGHVHGLDISPAMIAGAEDHATATSTDNVSFSVGDATIDRLDGFDGVYSRFGVMFFADPIAAFANLRAALRPGGRIGFVCWQAAEENPWGSGPFGIAREYVELPFHPDPTAPGPFAFGNPEHIASVVGGAGFVDLAIEPRRAPIDVGDDPHDAASRTARLMPPIAALADTDATAAASLTEALADFFGQWATSDGVQAPSAVWIVTARRHG